MVRERDLLEKPILFVTEGEDIYPYSCGYTKSGLPFYVASEEKNQTLNTNIDEILFLPITMDEFNNNTEDLFFGFRILINKGNLEAVGVLDTSMQMCVRTQVNYEISRVRYYPSGNKSIVIDKTYDAMFPTQSMTLQGQGDDLLNNVQTIIKNMIEVYCNWYVDRKI